MNELIEQIVAAIPAVWRRRWVGLIVTAAVCSVGWFMVMFVADRYVSETRVFVDTQQLLRPLLRRLTVDVNPARELQILQQTLVSRPNLERVLRVTNLDTGITDPRQKETLVNSVRENLRVQSERNNLFRISFEDESPETAHAVVRSLLDIFMETNLGTSRREMDSAQRFLQEQTKRYEEQLNQKEEEIARFRKDNIDFLGGGQGYYERLEKARQLVAAISGQYHDAISQSKELAKQLEGIPEYFESDSMGQAFGGPPSSTEERILDLEHKLDALLMTYTERHPDVRAIRRRLASLRAKFQLEMDALAEQEIDQAGTVKTPNPVYQSIKTRLVDTETQYASLKDKLAREKAKLEELESLSDKIPLVEADLSRLVRDHGIMKANYAELRASSERAEISESRETEVEKVQFRIIDPPQVPKLPVGIKRSLMVTGVLGVAAAIGLGICILIVLTQKTFYSPRTLAEVTGLRVLGTVTMIGRKHGAFYRSLNHAPFLAACVLLVGTYGGLMVFERNVGLNKLIPEETKAEMLDRLPGAIRTKLQ